MSYEAHKEDYKGLHISIMADDDAINPYEDWDVFGKFYHWHKRGFFGENYAYKQDELKDLIDSVVNDGGVAVPVFLYEHSGQTIRTGPFSCPWDSGQVGFWIATKEDIAKEFSGDKEKAIACIEAQVKTMDDYLTGNVYGFIVTTPEGDDVESCWGFYGDYDQENGVLAEAKSIADYYAEKYPDKFIAEAI